ncbi:MAG: putative glycoside hydrolase, partial [Candidatus Aenigmatarchaeota archaeon]
MNVLGKIGCVAIVLLVFICSASLVSADSLPVPNPSFEGATWQADANIVNFEDWEFAKGADNGVIKTWVETSNTHSGGKAFHFRTEAPNSTNLSLSILSNNSKRIPIDENNYMELGFWSYLIEGDDSFDVSVRFYFSNGSYSKLWGTDAIGSSVKGRWSVISRLWHPSSMGQGNGYIPVGAKYASVVLVCNWHQFGVRERIYDDVFVNQYGYLPEFVDRIAGMGGISGRLTDKGNRPIQARIEAYGNGASYASSETDQNGSYNLGIRPGTYDIKYDFSSSIPDFWIMLKSKRMDRGSLDLISKVSAQDTSSISFSMDNFYEQVVQVSSPKKPKSVLIGGVVKSEVPTLSNLKKDTWFYDSASKSLYIDAGQAEEINLGFYTFTWNFREYSAEAIASGFNMSQSWWVSPSDIENHYGPKMDKVHTINPTYKALIYRNIINVYDYWDDEFNLANNSGWLLKDSKSEYITSITYPENYRIDITNPDYQKWVAAKIKSWLDQNPFFDGVFVDNGLRHSESEWEWNMNAIPVNPRTGAYFTWDETKEAYSRIWSEISNAIGPSKNMAVNGIWNGE